MREPEIDPNETTADADLVLRSRSGDADAFGELWRRHYGAAIVAARSITTSLDADDLVQEAYAKILRAIRRGGGPTGSFRAYLFTAVRNTAAAWGGARRETTVDEIAELEDPATSEEAVDAALDRSLTTTAFRSLPSRWQEVLWYTEVEQMKPAEVAPLLGMTPSAVSQLAFRAREGLREAWIQAHIAAVGEGTECRWTIERLGAHSRGNLGARDRGKVDRHLSECPRCAIVAAEAHDVGSRLVLVLLPLAVGVTGAAGYLASLQQSGSAPMALMAMPQGVLEGATAGSGELIGYGPELFGQMSDGAAALLGAVGAAAGGAGAAGSTGSSAGSSSGSAWTVGGVIAGAVSALGIAGAVLAATVLPLGGTPTSDPAAEGDGSAPAAASVEADDELAAHEGDAPETAAPDAPETKDEVAPAPPAPAPETTPEPERTSAPASPSPTTTPSPATTPSPSPTPSASPSPTPTPTPTSTPTPTPTPEPIPFALDLERSAWPNVNGSDPMTFVVTAPPGTTVTLTILDQVLSGNDPIELEVGTWTATTDADGVAIIELRESVLFTTDDDIVEITDGSQTLRHTLGDINTGDPQPGRLG